MKFVCPVPDVHCKGAKVQIEPLSMRRDPGMHGSIEEMHRCIKNYYVNILGYEQKSRREYIDPETNRVLVICKKPGIPLRRGKEGARYIHRTWLTNRRSWLMPW